MAEVSVLIAGLGNPGEKYKKNRHNAGFLALEALVERLGAEPAAKLGDSDTWKTEFTRRDGKKIPLVLARPRTFMNLSGQALSKVVKNNKITPDKMIVLHDEIEISFGDVRLKKGGGHKGHNGLRDIIAHCGSADFFRVRLGVGRPDHDDIADHVLSNFSGEEMNDIPGMMERAADMVVKWLEEK